MATQLDLSDACQALSSYTACDISDALVKLGFRDGGFLADINPISQIFSPTPATNASAQAKIIAPAYTVKFWPRNETPSHSSNIPEGTHYVDLVEKSSIVLISQPPGQTCAVLGGIMALRMSVLGVSAIVVDGRVRDLEELQHTGVPIWSKGTSTVGAGAESKPLAIQVSIEVGKVRVGPGDLIFCDPASGVVAIPRAYIGEVLALLPELTEADDKVKAAVKNGETVYDAFQKYRQ